jgi:hypothetical protein
MRIRRGVSAGGITIAAIGVSFTTAGAAAAAPVTNPVVGVITGPHTFTFSVSTNQVVVVGETLHPNAPFYNANVPVLAVTTSKGVTTVTTGFTFLPLNRKGEVTTFTVVPRPRDRPL